MLYQKAFHLLVILQDVETCVDQVTSVLKTWKVKSLMLRNTRYNIQKRSGSFITPVTKAKFSTLSLKEVRNRKFSDDSDGGSAVPNLQEATADMINIDNSHKHGTLETDLALHATLRPMKTAPQLFYANKREGQGEAYSTKCGDFDPPVMFASDFTTSTEKSLHALQSVIPSVKKLW